MHDFRAEPCAGALGVDVDFELCCADGEVKSHDSVEGAWVSWFLFPFIHPPTHHQALLDNGFAEPFWGRREGVEQAWDLFRSRCSPGEVCYGRLEVGVILVSGFTGGGYSDTQVCAPLILITGG